MSPNEHGIYFSLAIWHAIYLLIFFNKLGGRGRKFKYRHWNPKFIGIHFISPRIWVNKICLHIEKVLKFNPLLKDGVHHGWLIRDALTKSLTVASTSVRIYPLRHKYCLGSWTQYMINIMRGRTSSLKNNIFNTIDDFW